MAATVIAAAGMRAMNLGPDTPVAALQHAVVAHQPRLVWISASAPVPSPRAKSFARWLLALPKTVTVVCGGRGVDALADAGVRRLDSMVELSAVAASLVPTRR
jgi:methanogenic corrinoid protein MtbC1